MAFDDKATYYDAGGIELIKILEAKLTHEQFKGWLLGNVIKYSCRANHKGAFWKDVFKIGMYTGKLKELEDKEKAETKQG